jgi:hypothetical protein
VNCLSEEKEEWKDTQEPEKPLLHMLFVKEPKFPDCLWGDHRGRFSCSLKVKQALCYFTLTRVCICSRIAFDRRLSEMFF